MKKLLALLLLWPGLAWGQSPPVGIVLGTPVIASSTFPCSSGQLIYRNAQGNSACQNAPATGVTSVGLALPSIFTVSGSPVTGAGTLTGTLNTQIANTLFAGPPSGIAATPAFRSLIGADLPLPGAGSLGGVFSKAAVSSNWLRSIGTDGNFTASQPACGDLSNAGTGCSGTIPTGSALTAGNDTNVTLTLGGSPTTALINAASITVGWTGTLGLARGGTNANLSATGGASQVLQQASSGAAITVGRLACSDLSNAGSGCSGSASAVGANPTASIGLSAVNGSAATFMRSDAAPTIDQIAAWSFTGLGATTINGTLTINNASVLQSFSQNGQTTASIINATNGTVARARINLGLDTGSNSLVFEYFPSNNTEVTGWSNVGILGTSSGVTNGWHLFATAGPIDFETANPGTAGLKARIPSAGGFNLASGGNFGLGSASSPNTFVGSPAAATLQLGAADVASGAVAQFLRAQSNTGASTTGPDFTIQGTKGTTAGGSLVFQTAATTTYATALQLDATQQSIFSGNTIWASDNSKSIGTSITTGRPSFIYAGTAVYSSDVSLSGNVTAVSGTPKMLLAANAANIIDLVTVGLGNNAFGAAWQAFKTRASDSSAGTAASSGDQVLSLQGWAANGSSYHFAGGIEIHVDGTPSSTSMPGRIEMYTTPSGSNSTVKNFVLNNAGSLQLNAYTTAGLLQNDASGNVTTTNTPTISLSQNAETAFTLTNPGSGTATQASMYVGENTSNKTGGFTYLATSYTPVGGFESLRANSFALFSASGSVGMSFIASGTSANTQFYTGGYASSKLRATITSAGSFVLGNAALATNATDGFLYIEAGAGAPTGVPTANTGRVPLYYDSTNDQLYIYNSGWKQPKTPAGAAIVNWQ